ncbi:uncharacterized protein [Rutidosis leptorrhynchoides]|uniref:uncharacterized protein n=1 Tax=Rutidosis leptorrhynchoides TaxID=125765 RepID=UPI003A9A0077
MAHFEALYGRKCRTSICWDEEGDRKLLTSEIVQQTAQSVHMIRDRIKMAQDRQQAYANKRRRPLEFVVHDESNNIEGIWSTGRFLHGKEYFDLGSRASLRREMSKIHDVFHVSVLKKYVYDPSHVLEHPPVELKEDLS